MRHLLITEGVSTKLPGALCDAGMVMFVATHGVSGRGLYHVPTSASNSTGALHPGSYFEGTPRALS
jgi:hypothetical protein